MRAILGQTIAAAAGAFLWTLFWEWVKGGRGLIVRPSWPEARRRPDR
jgi:hypothetical protein